MDSKAWRIVIGLLLVVVLLATWESMSIILKGMQTTYHQSFFISYVCRSSYLICIPIWWVLKTVTGRTEDALPRWPGHLFVFLMSFIGIWGIFAWYVSLTMTDIAFNNAIYQTTAVFVYLLSIPMLKMKVSAYGICSLVLALGGLALVTVFSPSDSTPATCTWFNSSAWSAVDVAKANVSTLVADAGSCCNTCEKYKANTTHPCVAWCFNATDLMCHMSDHNATSLVAATNGTTSGTVTAATDNSSILGYILCLISVVVYALFEIFYKKFEHLLAAPPAKNKDADKQQQQFESNGGRAVTYMGSHVSDDDNDRTELLVAKSEKGSVNHSPRGGGDGNIGVVAESPTAAAPVGGEEVAKAEGKLDLLTPVLDCLKFLGLMGLYTSIPVAPCVWLLDVTEVEVFVNPFIDCQGISCFSYMIIDGCLDMAYNIGLLLGISLTSPRFMSAGTIMIIPVGVIVDAIQYVVVVITAATAGHCGCCCVPCAVVRCCWVRSRALLCIPFLTVVDSCLSTMSVCNISLRRRAAAHACVYVRSGTPTWCGTRGRSWVLS